MTMAERYDRIAGAHKYLVGFIRKDKVYYVLLTFGELCELLKADRESSKRGGAIKLRVRVSSEQAVTFILTGRAVELCELSELSANPKYNKGENFERIVTEKLTGETWVKDNIPFYVQGDIRLNGEEVQVKLTGAELTNERTLARAEAAVAA
jgi:hypothetical protein